MIISLRAKQGKDIRIVIPTGLALNRITACILPAALKRRGLMLTRRQLLAILRALRECRKRNSGWKLIEAETADGEHVEITI